MSNREKLSLQTVRFSSPGQVRRLADILKMEIGIRNNALSDLGTLAQKAPAALTPELISDVLKRAETALNGATFKKRDWADDIGNFVEALCAARLAGLLPADYPRTRSAVSTKLLGY